MNTYRYMFLNSATKYMHAYMKPAHIQKKAITYTSKHNTYATQISIFPSFLGS